MAMRIGPAARLAIHRGICLLACLAAATPCGAGSVAVIVRDTTGSPVAGERLTLHPPLEPGEMPWFQRIRERSVSGSTGRDGRALFEGLVPGQYTVSFPALSNPRLVAPEHNPYTAVPVVTVLEGEGLVALEIALETGTTVVCRMEADSSVPVFATVWLREIDHEFRRIERIGNVDDEDYVLVPGRWEVILEPPPGFLLRDVEVDGRKVEGHRAMLELEPSGPTSFVTWRLAPPTAELKGSVRFVGPRAGVEIHARLLEPGPWIEGLRAGSEPDVAVAAVGPRTSKYSVMVQDGRWELQAVGDRIVSTTPESAVVFLAPGGVESVDFVVETEGSGSELVVGVLDPRGKDVAGATVEVRALNDAPPDAEPLYRTQTVGSGTAYIPDLPAGDLVVAAGHPNYLDAEIEVRDFDPEGDPRKVEVQLRMGATLHVTAADSDDRPVPGVRLELARADGGPQTKISDSELLATILRKQESTDATGHAWFRGIWPGPYRLSGRLEGSGSTTGFVRILDQDRPLEEMEIELADAEEREIRVRVLPAASFTARLHCVRGQPLPGKASIAVVPESTDLETLDAAEWMEEAALLLEDAPLSDEKRDVLAAGPLEEGAYRLAVRPSGHDRWTWALGTERASEGAILQGAPGDSADLGAVPVDCGPAIAIRLGAPGKGPVPSLSLVHPRYDTFSIGGVVRNDAGEHTVAHAVVDAYAERLVVRDLPEGAGVLQIRLRHPYFLPSPWITIPVEAMLERGRTFEVQHMLSAVGGALLVIHPAAAVRISGAAVEPRVVELLDGRVEVPSLPAGLYRVDLCSDAACKRILETRDGLEIQALGTTEVR